MKRIRARADAGFYCWEAVEAYTEAGCKFVMVASKTPRLVNELQAATWKRSKHTDADFECQFAYQPEGWDKAFRFVGLRYGQREPDSQDPEQRGFFEGLACRFRVLVTNFDEWTIAEVEELTHRTMATTRLRMLYLAARIWRHGGALPNKSACCAIGCNSTRCRPPWQSLVVWPLTKFIA